MNRRHWLQAHLGAAAGLALSAGARAQSGGPIRLVVGFAPGGSIDGLARLTAEHITAGTGRTAIVENKTGAAGRLAIETVKAAAPDGDTLLVAPQGPMTLFTHVFRNLKFDPAKDFVPITRLTETDYALTIGPLVPAKDLKGFREWLRTAGDKATYGSPGAGTVPHFIGVSIARRLGVPMAHVPYRGSALSMTDLAGGAIAATVSPVTEALELHKAGKVRIIATTGERRTAFVDGVPTLKESGVDVDAPGWFGIWAPAGVPRETLDRLRTAIHAGLATPAAKERLAKLGMTPAPSTGEELLAQQKRESEMWGPVVKASGFTPED